jgi:hypothetical protein
LKNLDFQSGYWLLFSRAVCMVSDDQTR